MVVASIVPKHSATKRARPKSTAEGALNCRAPVREYLNVRQCFDHFARRDVCVATIPREDFASAEQLLPELDKVRIGRLNGNDFCCSASRT